MCFLQNGAVLGEQESEPALFFVEERAFTNRWLQPTGNSLRLPYLLELVPAHLCALREPKWFCLLRHSNPNMTADWCGFPSLLTFSCVCTIVLLANVCFSRCIQLLYSALSENGWTIQNPVNHCVVGFLHVFFSQLHHLSFCFAH